MERERYPSWLNMQLPERATDSSDDKKDEVPMWLSSKRDEEVTLGTNVSLPKDIKDMFDGISE